MKTIIVFLAGFIGALCARIIIKLIYLSIVRTLKLLFNFPQKVSKKHKSPTSSQIYPESNE